MDGKWFYSSEMAAVAAVVSNTIPDVLMGRPEFQHGETSRPWEPYELVMKAIEKLTARGFKFRCARWVPDGACVKLFTAPPDEEESAASVEIYKCLLKKKSIPSKYDDVMEKAVDVCAKLGILAMPPKRAADPPPSGNESGGGSPIPNDLSGFNGKDAAKVIAAMSDTDILRKWREAEDRSTVQKAIDDRIAALEE